MFRLRSHLLLAGVQGLPKAPFPRVPLHPQPNPLPPHALWLILYPGPGSFLTQNHLPVPLAWW